ncbi:MAG: NAD(P)-binding domain-containing protein [Proteobacteria bacterium]|nr:NAD(P)-binding domain-containing protein [Pseudomonadota bacterium]
MLTNYPELAPYLTYLIYLIPLVGFFIIYSWRHHKHSTTSHRQQQQSAAAGLTEPASLHPVIDPARCLGSGACVSACPEGNVIGMIKRKGQLINPSNCIGHGACKAACPHDAITLVFGSARRGVDIPNVKPNFETNVPGLFIAGELGGMGLIRNAIEQGRQAMDSIRKYKKGKAPLDVVIIGAGPSGLSATLGARQYKLKCKTIEQEELGGTVAHFPRGKLVMTQPATLPLIGKVKFRETTKEKLLEFWRSVEDKTGIEINYGERMETITQTKSGFLVKTSKGEYNTRTVLLAIGRRGTPRKLGVPGEENTKVVYRLVDPEQYRGQHVLVVGGGDAALEAATSISEEPDTTVTISYRSESFSRAKPGNRDKVAHAAESGKLNVLMKSNVKEVTTDKVIIEQEGKTHTLANDGIIVCAGGILPIGFLKELGIEIDTKYGTA